MTAQTSSSWLALVEALRVAGDGIGSPREVIEQEERRLLESQAGWSHALPRDHRRLRIPASDWAVYGAGLSDAYGHLAPPLHAFVGSLAPYLEDADFIELDGCHRPLACVVSGC